MLNMGLGSLGDSPGRCVGMRDLSLSLNCGEARGVANPLLPAEGLSFRGVAVALQDSEMRRAVSCPSGDAAVPWYSR